MTVLSAVIACVWFGGFWILSRDTANTPAVTLTGALASLIGTGFAASNIWPQVQAGYPQDSYWSLSISGYAGVLTISLVGIAVFFLFLAAKTRVLLRIAPRSNRVLLALIDTAAGQFAFAVLLSLSPQAYYTLYRSLIPGLPRQSVIKSWLDVDRLSLVAELGVTGSLSEHLSGLVLWSVIPFTLWMHLKHRHQDKTVDVHQR